MDNPITAAKDKLKLDDSGLAARLGVHRTTVIRMERRGAVSGPVALLLDQMLAEAGAPETPKKPNRGDKIEWVA